MTVFSLPQLTAKMFSKRWKAPATQHTFNSALHVQGLEARIDGLGSKFLSSLVTINPNMDLQHLFASYATFASGGALARIAGSTTNRVDSLTSVGIMSPEAMGFVCYVVKAVSVKPDAMLGDELTEDMLADTAFRGETGCHLRSVPLAFFLTMQLDVIHGNIQQGSTSDCIVPGSMDWEPNSYRLWLRLIPTWIYSTYLRPMPLLHLAAPWLGSRVRRRTGWIR